MIEDENADIYDLIALLEELNQTTDLTVKLNNHSKIWKVIGNDEESKIS